MQAEDCLLRAAVHHRGKHGGLVHILNERYYQFIVWRAVLPVWHAVTEREGNRDLILTCEDGKHYFEMKTWFGATGKREIPGMQRDISRLQNHDHGYLLVVSANPEGLTLKNLNDLPQEIGQLDIKAGEHFRFHTVAINEQPFEFWIAGWPVIRAVKQEAID